VVNNYIMCKESLGFSPSTYNIPYLQISVKASMLPRSKGNSNKINKETTQDWVRSHDKNHDHLGGVPRYTVWGPSIAYLSHKHN
jgi:dolichol kinase